MDESLWPSLRARTLRCSMYFAPHSPPQFEPNATEPTSANQRKRSSSSSSRKFARQPWPAAAPVMGQSRQSGTEEEAAAVTVVAVSGKTRGDPLPLRLSSADTRLTMAATQAGGAFQRGNSMKMEIQVAEQPPLPTIRSLCAQTPITHTAAGCPSCCCCRCFLLLERPPNGLPQWPLNCDELLLASDALASTFVLYGKLSIGE
mmetsp:Transcript_46594/g.94015  ORF Transcript_46594/g.94015 Transcript_46594/m.94015 type:complete len:203 (+) Transcript_46594:347-955(+)